MANPVVHFEIPANDVKRAKKFYEKTFGWKIDYLKEMDYYVISAKTKDGGKEVGIDGGMMQRKNPGQMFMNYISVASVDTSLKLAVANGAKIALPKTPIGDMGFIGAFVDPEGNCIGLHEMNAKKTAKKK
jgi:predicted enzyme related to lactoylglutathione lyase